MLVRMAIMKKFRNNRCWRGCGQKARETSYTVGGNVSWCSHYGEQHGVSLKNKKQLLYDPAIPLVSMCMLQSLCYCC